MKRPECYEFGMNFMGDPEQTEIRRYVEWLENRVRRIAIVAFVAGVLVGVVIMV